eukprot:6642294-Prymnesium_polylepis.1
MPCSAARVTERRAAEAEAAAAEEEQRYRRRKRTSGCAISQQEQRRDGEQLSGARRPGRGRAAMNITKQINRQPRRTYKRISSPVG